MQVYNHALQGGERMSMAYGDDSRKRSVLFHPARSDERTKSGHRRILVRQDASQIFGSIRERYIPICFNIGPE